MKWKMDIFTRDDEVALRLQRSDLKLPPEGVAPPDGAVFVMRQQTNLEYRDALTEPELLAKCLAGLAAEVTDYAREDRARLEKLIKL